METRCEPLLSEVLIISAQMIPSWLIAQPVVVSTSQFSLTCMLPHAVTELCPDSVGQP